MYTCLLAASPGAKKFIFLWFPPNVTHLPHKAWSLVAFSETHRGTWILYWSCTRFLLEKLRSKSIWHKKVYHQMAKLFEGFSKLGSKNCS